MYYKYRKSPSTGRSASLRLTQRGVLVLLYDDGNVHSEIFFEFGAVVFVEASHFAPVKTSSERKPKAFFLPVDQEGGGRPGAGAVTEKHAFLVEKNFHFLVTTSHPPLVVCVVRRPQGVKALDCHVFALDTVENALHISSLIASAQTAPGPAGVGVATAGVGRGGRGPGFDKARGGGDVIRTEYGEYSVYRGASQMSHPQHPPQDSGITMGGHGPSRMTGGPGSEAGFGPPGYEGHQRPQGHQGHQGPPGGRNGYLGAGVPGGIVLTQDNFLSDSSSDHQHQLQQSQQYMQQQQQHHYTADVIPRAHYGGGGGGNMRPPGPQHMAGGYHNRPPDVIMHARSQMPGDVGGDNGYPPTSLHDRSYGSSDHGSGVRMRYEEGGGGGGNHSRQSGSRGSGGQISPRGPVDYPSGGGGGGGYIPPGARPMFPGGPIPPSEPARPSKYSPPLPTSPRGPPSVEMRGGGGPPPSQEIFSASNRESREMDPETEQQTMGGKPVAKVPPHFKAGIKVLPSDFRMVKLKHKTLSEEKRSSSMSDDGYDNNKDVMDRYREMQESEQFSKHGGHQHYPDVAAPAAHMRAGGHVIHEDHSRDFRSRWEDEEDGKPAVGAGVFYDDRSSGFSDGDLVYRQDHRNGGVVNNSNNNNNRNRYSDFNPDLRSQPVRGGAGSGVKSQSAYSISGGRGDSSSNADSTGSDPSRFKDLEIANMFSNIRLEGSNAGNPKMNPDSHHRQRNEFPEVDHGFENGLGYLP